MKKIFFSMIATLAVLLTFPFLIHNKYTDYFNPLLKTEISYAQVPKNTQKYYNVQAVNKLGKKLPYKLNFVGGYDASKEYIVIQHKGQYVKLVDYIAGKQMPMEWITKDTIVNIVFNRFKN